MTEVWLKHVDFEKWNNCWKTDFKYWLAGGFVFSNGDMSCIIHILQPKSDKRFKIGKRYVEFDEIPCIQQTRYKYPDGGPSLVNDREYVSIVI